MAELVLGPVLRWIDDTSATIWVEADRPSMVEVLGHEQQTFEVAGHHYALVDVDLAGRAAVTTYEVRLDGDVAWPPDGYDWPAPVIRRPSTSRARIVFGSCRAAAPDTEPWTLPRTEHPDGLGVDALEELARRLVDTDHDQWPDLLLMLGDQVYADAASPDTRAFARSRRDTDRPPYEDVADFEEYTCLYRESWTDPEIRWLLSTVPTGMVFDDHDMIDDWNISAEWLQDMRATDWWHDRIVGGIASYWVYQHLGNLSPAERSADAQYRAVLDADGDAAELLWEFAQGADRHPESVRWSFRARLHDTDIVVMDSRAGRVLDGERHMLDEPEWQWLAEQLSDPAPHVVVGSTLPVLLPIAIHDLEGWNERVADGAWGALAARGAEVVRRAIDLEHWAAFSASFDRLLEMLREVAAHPRVRTLVLVSGDVHYGQVDVARFDDVATPMWQLVASPMRQEVNEATIRAFAFARSGVGRRAGRLLRRTSGGHEPGVSWDTIDGPIYDNHVATLELTEDGATVTYLRADRTPGLEVAMHHDLS